MKMSPKFKVGDMIVVTATNMDRLYGEVFTIKKVDQYTIVVDDGTVDGMLLFKTEVEKVK